MKRITVTVDPGDYEVFGQMARDSDVSVSWLIRRAMREFLEQHEHDRVVTVALGTGRQAG